LLNPVWVMVLTSWMFRFSFRWTCFYWRYFRSYGKSCNANFSWMKKRNHPLRHQKNKIFCLATQHLISLKHIHNHFRKNAQPVCVCWTLLKMSLLLHKGQPCFGGFFYFSLPIIILALCNYQGTFTLLPCRPGLISSTFLSDQRWNVTMVIRLVTTGGGAFGGSNPKCFLYPQSMVCPGKLILNI